MSEYKTRDEKIYAGLSFISGVLKSKSWNNDRVKSFWIKLMGLINDKFDGVEEETPELATPEQQERINAQINI